MLLTTTQMRRFGILKLNHCTVVHLLGNKSFLCTRLQRYIIEESCMQPTPFRLKYVKLPPTILGDLPALKCLRLPT